MDPFKLEHLFLFTPESLKAVAVANGFEVLSVKRARKAMTLGYLKNQLETYGHPVLTPAARLLTGLFHPWCQQPFTVTMGEMLAFLRKVDPSLPGGKAAGP